MKTKVLFLIMVLLIAILSGCIDSRINGLYVDEKDPSISLKFMDNGKVLDNGKDDNKKNTSAVMDYKIDNNTVILSWFGMAFVLNIQDNGKTLVSSDGVIYRKVE